VIRARASTSPLPPGRGAGRGVCVLAAGEGTVRGGPARDDGIPGGAFAYPGETQPWPSRNGGFRPDEAGHPARNGSSPSAARWR
jgi:hypothetical protein